MLRQKSAPKTSSGRIQFLPIRRIHPNPMQARRVEEEGALLALSRSILAQGILQPLCVRSGPDGYELVSGERRWRAAKLAGLERVPCMVLSVSDLQADTLALADNMQRKELDYWEQAEGIARLIRVYHLSQEQVAQSLGRSQSAVANKLRLLRHTKAVRAAIQRAGLSERHARALLCIEDETQALQAVSYIADHELTVSQTEAYLEHLRHAAMKDEPTQMAVHTLEEVAQKFYANGISADVHRQEQNGHTFLSLTVSLP